VFCQVADAQRGQAALELPDQRLVDRLLHEQPRARAADVALVEVDAVDDASTAWSSAASSKMMFAAFPTQLERQMLAGSREWALDRLPDPSTR
jgi:hypothetical protein